jgi:DNA-binding NarL/FixJ family response regulator
MPVDALFIEAPTMKYSVLIHASRQSEDAPLPVEIAISSQHHYLDVFSALQEQAHDVVVVDLSLIPHSERNAYLCQIHESFPAIPFVLIGQPEEDEFALSMITCGVQQFLLADSVTSDNLQRAIRHAAARNDLVQRLVSRLRSQERERELGKLDQLAQSTSSVSERMTGSLPLSQSIPDTFEELVTRYEQLLDIAIERQAYHVQYDLANAVKAFASELGRLRAGPRDIIQIHSTAVKRRLGNGTPERSQAIINESRLLMIELMGDLAQYYRTISMGVTG